MICLFVIVFIAELIILYHLIMFLYNTDKAVCMLTEQIDKSRMKLKWRMTALTEISEGINEIIPNLIVKAKKTRKNLIIRFINQGLQSIILLFFKPKYKKFLLGMKTGMGVLRKLLRV